MTDAIDLATVILTPSDVRDWPITTAITALTTSAQGLELAFSKRDDPDWPDIVPTGWGGPIYYTIFLGARLADGIHLAAALNVFRGEGPAVGGDVTNLTIRPDPTRAPGQYANNLYYLDAALGQHAAIDGETVYAMVVAGGWRGIHALSVRERSNVVAFQASSSGPTRFTFATPAPVDPPIVLPAPIIAPVPLDASAAILAKLNDLELLVLTRTPPIYEGTIANRFLGTSTVTLTPKKATP